MKGRRLPDLAFSEFPDEFLPGDYWKILNQDGTPRKSEDELNLNGTCWFVIAPIGEGYGIGRLERHTVHENEDGTISVQPEGNSSNSIRVFSAAGEWHGYIDHGVWNHV